jgi:hypothetical protein
MKKKVKVKETANMKVTTNYQIMKNKTIKTILSHKKKKKKRIIKQTKNKRKK